MQEADFHRPPCMRTGRSRASEQPWWGKEGLTGQHPFPTQSCNRGDPAPCPGGVRAATRPWDPGFLSHGLGSVGAVAHDDKRWDPLGSCAFFEGCKQSGLNAVQKLSAPLLFWEQGGGAVPSSAFGSHHNAAIRSQAPVNGSGSLCTGRLGLSA